MIILPQSCSSQIPKNSMFYLLSSVKRSFVDVVVVVILFSLSHVNLAGVYAFNTVSVVATNLRFCFQLRLCVHWQLGRYWPHEIDSVGVVCAVWTWTMVSKFITLVSHVKLADTETNGLHRFQQCIPFRIKLACLKQNKQPIRMKNPNFTHAIHQPQHQRSEISSIRDFTTVSVFNI